jgi:hypothetical protein
MVCPGYAHLETAKIAEIKKLEEELGVLLLAHERPASVASLSDSDLQQIREIEKKMGVRLVAYA